MIIRNLVIFVVFILIGYFGGKYLLSSNDHPISTTVIRSELYLLDLKLKRSESLAVREREYYSNRFGKDNNANTE